MLSATSSTGLNITGSQLISGQVDNTGIYKFSGLQLSSQTNMSIIESTLSSVAQSANISLLVTSTQIPSYLSLTQTNVQTQQNPGFLTLSATYGVALDRTDINATKSSFHFAAYLLSATDSVITSNVTFGGTLGVGNLYNTTTYGLATIGSGKFSSYGWLLAEVLSKPSMQPISNAVVDVWDPATGTLIYSSQTNSSGWAKISVLLKQDIPPTPITKFLNYVVQASNGDISSAQFLVPTNNTFLTTLPVGLTFDPNIVIGSSNSNYQALTNEYSLQNYTFLTVPASPPFPPPPPASSIAILSNAALLNFVNNYSFSEFNYRVVGQAGSTFYFVVIYPKNMSTVPLVARVTSGGVQTKVQTRVQSNSTHHFVIFSIPSGSYSIALSYIRPSCNCNTTSPPYYPGPAAVVAIVIVGLVGASFVGFYLRRREK